MTERPPGGPGVQTGQRAAKLLEDGHPCPQRSWQPGGAPTRLPATGECIRPGGGRPDGRRGGPAVR